MNHMRERILIIDHDPVMARLIGTVIHRYHYRVAGTAENGREALSQALETEPDLALVALEMEGTIDGVNTARYLRTIFDLPVIFYSPATDSASLSRARLAHPSGVLPTPFNDRQICTAIDVALFHHTKQMGTGATFPSREVPSWRGSGAAITDPKGKVWFLNRAGKELLGLAQGAVHHRPFDDLATFLDPVRREQIRGVIEGAMNGGPYPLVKNVCVMREDGGERYLGLIAHPLRSLENQLQGVVSFLHPL